MLTLCGQTYGVFVLTLCGQTYRVFVLTLCGQTYGVFVLTLCDRHNMEMFVPIYYVDRYIWRVGLL